MPFVWNAFFPPLSNSVGVKVKKKYFKTNKNDNTMFRYKSLTNSKPDVRKQSETQILKEVIKNFRAFYNCKFYFSKS